MTPRKIFCVCVLLTVTQHSVADTAKATDEKKCSKMEGRSDSQITTLRKHLLCNYDKQSAPVNASFENRVPVEVSLGVYRITYKGSPGWGNTDMYNMVENTPNWFTMSTYVFMFWKDERLQWNKSEYNNQTRIHLERYEVWTPYVFTTCGNNVVFAEEDGTMTSFCWTQLIGNCRPVFFSWGDQRECKLSFRVEPADQVQLYRANDTSDDTDYQVSNSASWSVVKAKRIFPLRAGQENADFVKIHKQVAYKYGPGFFETSVTIQKNFAIQDASIFAPAAVLFILLISSTWIPATQEARVALLSTTVIVQVYMFQQACRAMPFLAGEIVNIVGLYQDLIICSGVAVVEWLIAYFIARREESSKGNAGATAAAGPGSSVFSTLKTICVISAKDSRGINISLILDRLFFLLLSITSFMLVVILGRRPPSLPFEREEMHQV